MRVFVTGAAGSIGSAVVSELLTAGHRVVGLVPPDAAADAALTAGAEVRRGTPEDLGGLYHVAAAADGVLHLDVNHDLADRDAAGRRGLRAVEALGAALEGTGKPLVVASGTLLLAMIAPGRLGTEDIVPGPGATQPRAALERAALSMAARGVRTSVARLAPTVHGEDAGGLVPRLTAIARAKGVSAYVGDGSNRWPAVHRLDAARLLRLAVEAAPAGSMLHAVGEEGVPFRDIAEAIGRRLDLPAAGITAEDARGHFGWPSAMVPLDNPTSSALTRRRLGWRPLRPALAPERAAGRDAVVHCELCRVTMRRSPQLA